MCLMTSQSYIVHLTSAVSEGVVLTSEYDRLDIRGCTERKGPECCSKECQLPDGKDTPEYYTLGGLISKLLNKIALV
jgi:hypothetical protein